MGKSDLLETGKDSRTDRWILALSYFAELLNPKESKLEETIKKLFGEGANIKKTHYVFDIYWDPITVEGKEVYVRYRFSEKKLIGKKRGIDLDGVQLKVSGRKITFKENKIRSFLEKLNTTQDWMEEFKKIFSKEVKELEEALGGKEEGVNDVIKYLIRPFAQLGNVSGDSTKGVLYALLSQEKSVGFSAVKRYLVKSGKHSYNVQLSTIWSKKSSKMYTFIRVEGEKLAPIYTHENSRRKLNYSMGKILSEGLGKLERDSNFVDVKEDVSLECIEELFRHSSISEIDLTKYSLNAPNVVYEALSSESMGDIVKALIKKAALFALKKALGI